MANTVFVVKQSITTATPPNGTLESGELGYSFVSNTAFIGGPDGNSVLPIGGLFYIGQGAAAFAAANAAFAAANAASGGSIISAYNQANTATEIATNAYDKANSSNVLAHTTDVKATAAFLNSNTAYDQANTAATNAATADGKAVTADTKAVAAFAKANTALPAAGGTVSGDLGIQGNLTVSGAVTYQNTNAYKICGFNITLNADIPSGLSPIENAGIEINRGNSANVSLIWNESTDIWLFTNAGSVFNQIASNVVVEAAFAKANAVNTFSYAADAKAVAAFAQANTANTVVIPSGRLVGGYTGITGLGTITTGVWQSTDVEVAYGGTGRSTFANNGILYGNLANPVNVTNAGTEGQVLQVNSNGVPEFGIIDGGTF